MSREPSRASAGTPRGDRAHSAPEADDAARIDARLVRESRSGNRRARRALVDRHQHAVYNLALRMLGAPDAAAGVAEETFVKAFRRLPALSSDQRVAPWLLRIAHNTAADALRRAERSEPSAAPVALPAPAAAHSGEGRTGSAADAVGGRSGPASDRPGQPLAAAFEQLPMRYRAAIVLRYQAGLSFAEVGDVMGVPEQTARTRVEGARRALAERLRTATHG
ncbi:MAG: hypothetical protein J4F37_05570 [Acidobacteria bacterium]|nr:hypothetical protein [Acidobacteriota bacterium]